MLTMQLGSLSLSPNSIFCRASTLNTLTIYLSSSCNCSPTHGNNTNFPYKADEVCLCPSILKSIPLMSNSLILIHFFLYMPKKFHLSSNAFHQYFFRICLVQDFIIRDVISICYNLRGINLRLITVMPDIICFKLVHRWLMLSEFTQFTGMNIVFVNFVLTISINILEGQ